MCHMSTVGRDPDGYRCAFDGWTRHTMVNDALVGTAGESICHQQPLLGLFDQPSPITVMLGKVLAKVAPKLVLPVKMSICSGFPTIQKSKRHTLAIHLSLETSPLVGASMLQAIDDVHVYALKYTHSVRLMLGGDDRICDPEAGRKLAANFGTSGGGTLDLVEYPKCYHELFNEVEKYDIFRSSQRMVGRRVEQGMSKERLIAILKDKSVNRNIHLASGKISDFYVDARQTTLSSEGALVIADLSLELLHSDVVGIGGPVTVSDSHRGSTILRAEQQGRSLSGFMARKAVKDTAFGNMVEGLWVVTQGSKVCMVEDTVTTAGSLVESHSICWKRLDWTLSNVSPL